MRAPGTLAGVATLHTYNSIVPLRLFVDTKRILPITGMELNGFLAGIVAAKEISPMIPITIYTDSKYIENAINCGWLNKWVRKNFKGIKNSDLWLQIEPLVRSLNISVVWVKGHSSSLENNIADRFACEARDGLHGKSSIIYFLVFCFGRWVY